MKQLINIYVPGDPIPQGQMFARLRRDGRPYLAPQTSKKWKEWRNKVTVAAQEALGKQKTTHEKQGYRVSIRFVFGRPPSHLKKDGSLRKGQRNQHLIKPDIDNLVKAIHDSLTRAGVWGDDCEVVSLVAQKEYARGMLKAGAYIKIYEDET